MTKLRCLAALVLGLVLHLTPNLALAAQGQGTYAIIDPYYSNDMTYLHNASLISCPQTPPATIQSPFCGPTNGTQPINGIYLKVQWCSFQLYYDGTSSPPASCHYYVNSSGVDTVNPDTQSPCNIVSGYTYDTCPVTTGSTGSVLYQALGYIVMINTARHAAGLSPLQISIGLESGQNVPLSYILSSSSSYVGYADQPVLMGGNLDCARLPNVWTNKYISGYDAAIDDLTSVINSYATGTPLKGTIKIVKVTPITSVTNEFDMAGQLIAVTPPTDPHTITGQGPKLFCTTSPSTGAGKWLNDYNALYVGASSLPDCTGYQYFAQATECVEGSAIGHVRATLKSMTIDLPLAVMSIPTNGNSILPEIDCGTGMTTTCKVEAAGDQYQVFYFFQYVTDLFSTTTVAYAAADYAYDHNGQTGAFALTNSQLSTSWTGLQLDPTNATYNFFSDASNPNNATCALNNTGTPHGVTYTLDGATFPVTGVLTGPGTLNGWQTQVLQGGNCSLPTGDSSPNTYYDYIMKSGWANPTVSGGNGLFIEVETDAAFDDISSCSAQLTLATTSLLANNPATAVCPYP